MVRLSRKCWVYGFSATLIVAVALPLFQGSMGDSYPLSTYPMFSHPRERPWLMRARGIDREGRVVVLSPRHIANDEVMQATVTVARAIALGPATSQELCRSIAGRVAASAGGRKIEWIELLAEQHDPVAYFTHAGPPRPLAVHRYVRCKVRAL